MVLLLIGPYRYNGVPLRRFNRTYMILTKTCVNISKVKVSSIKMKLFRRKMIKTSLKKNRKFVSKATKKPIIRRCKELILLQKSIDDSVCESVRKIPHLKQYLQSHFTLTNKDRPHMMRF